MSDAAAAAALAAVFRVVPLACRDGRLAIAGGAVLQLAGQRPCPGLSAGRALGITLDANGRATIVALPGDARPAGEIPRDAFVIAPAPGGAADAGAVATVELEVTVPPRTPPGDDLYVSTERSGWAPAEIRMDRADARRFRLALRVRSGTVVAFRITRGSYATGEREAGGALPPAHLARADRDGGRLSVAVAAWADDR